MQAVFAGGPTYQTWDVYKVGKYNKETPQVSAPAHEIVFGSAPAVNGSYSIEFGFRDQGIMLQVVYIATTEAVVMVDWIADCTALVGPNDLTIGGATFKRCFVEAGATRNSDIEKIIGVNADGTSATLYMMMAVIKVSSKGEAQ